MPNYTAVEPFFAPLPKHLIMRALELDTEIKVPKTLNVHKTAQILTAKCSLLRERITEPRLNAFNEIQDALRTHEYSTDWMLRKLGEDTPRRRSNQRKPYSPEAWSEWREDGLVLMEDKNLPLRDNSAALLTYRKLLKQRERRWLPSPPKEAQKAGYFAHEPLWWCWKQKTLSSPAVSCAMPMTEDQYEKGALYWTEYEGAIWTPGWMKVGKLGCARWGTTKTIEELERPVWDMSENDLRRWGIIISETYRDALDATPSTLHTLANLALLDLATQRLKEMQTVQFDNLPLTDLALAG